MQRNLQGNIMSLFSKKKKLIISGCSYTHNYAKTQKLEEFPIWGELLADQLDMELINLSRCGFGNRAIYTTLVEKMIVEKNVGLVVAMWSEFQRTSLYIDTATLNHLPRQYRDPNPWRCFLPERIVLDASWHEQFYKPPAVNPKMVGLKYEVSKCLREYHLDNIKSGVVESVGHMFAFQNVCENMGIPYLQMQGCWPTMAKKTYSASEGKDKQLALCLIDSPYTEKINDNFIGWPIVKSIGGYCFDSLLRGEQHNYIISEEDTHPNGDGHKLMSKVLYDEYKKIYS